jgi:signal transduction histidine kinase
MKFFRSLQAKYMLIIVLAISLVQMVSVVIAIFVSGMVETMDGKKIRTVTPTKLEEKWHQEAGEIEKVSKKRIDEHFAKWKKEFPHASMFWVDGAGKVASQLDVKEEIPSKWTSAYTAKFLKGRYAGDPYTIVAFIGGKERNGFIVFEIPRSEVNTPDGKIYEEYGTILFFGTIFVVLLFIMISFLFFRGIRKRLLGLQDAMVIRDVDSLPIQIETKKKDEIGQLEETFNTMVCELRESRQREQAEEQLRRELIASLSHDLRTPLTKLRAQAFSLRKENLSPEGNRSIQMLEDSVVNIDHLIENLMSYSLLMASKYQYEAVETDVVRYVRKCTASWYAVFEKEGFDIDVNLEPFKEQHSWHVDPIWLQRVLDNIFQNVLRHAKSGHYIGVKTESTDQYDAFIISDRGKGVEKGSNEKGAGIGLSIVDMMVKGMGLDWLIESNEHGTTIKIIRNK